MNSTELLCRFDNVPEYDISPMLLDD